MKNFCNYAFFIPKKWLHERGEGGKRSSLEPAYIKYEGVIAFISEFQGSPVWQNCRKPPYPADFFFIVDWWQQFEFRKAFDKNINWWFRRFFL